LLRSGLGVLGLYTLARRLTWALARLKVARELARRDGLLLEEALLRELVARMEALEGEVRALKEENARLREALRALEPPKRRPWWEVVGVKSLP